MEDHQFLKEIAENLALLTQLGLSVSVPPILCVYAASWLRNRFDLGIWIMVVFLIYGVVGGVTAFWKVWKTAEKRHERQNKK